MDDPTIFGALPRYTTKFKSTIRWTLGASDILFTNSCVSGIRWQRARSTHADTSSTHRLLSYLFKSGQVLPIDRGRGVYQPSLDEGIDLLEKAQWVHMFPEGYVNLSRKAHLRRFKWGVGRMLLEAGAAKAGHRPVIVPMWISGEF
jgi:monolysocardiolipin acyltransferase